ncbi:protein HEATR9 isoform X2 [Eptesicus fuscus]|uniref:protein HEATR9 isoform X2 n=1 Tax=Eptesicus fuscus TaxID=29078 RepID=UPI002403AD39|nr:protein HEATR9 isoform X2 [Eptesicus fuscus]
MAYEKSVDFFEIARSMFEYPWLEYPNRTKELKKASVPVYLPLSCHQTPKEEFPPSPECWRQHPAKPNAAPYCYFEKPELYTHWHTLYDHQQERMAQKMLQKMRDQPRYHFKEGSAIQKVHLPMIKLTTKYPKEPKTLHPMEDPLKWQRLKRTQIGDEGMLASVLQMLMLKSPNEAALEAALCLGFLRPCSNTARDFLLQCLCHGSMSQRMKTLRMLVKIMRVHSAEVIRAVLDQLCSSCVLEHRFEATQMLKTIGLEQIQAQELEGLTFELLRRKIFNEPFLAMRQAVAETVEELKMKPMMMNLVEEQLMNPQAASRQEAVISLGVLGIRSPQVFHLLLDMLDTENSQSVKKSLQETLTILASIDPWIEHKLKNKVLFVSESPPTKEKAEPTRFRKENEKLEELNIRDFRLARLSPLFVAKSSASSDQQEKLRAQKRFTRYLTSAFTSCSPKPLKPKSQATGPWTPKIRKQL